MVALINWFSQLVSVTKLSVTTIFERKGASLAAVVGIGGVVAVLVGVLSIAQGFRGVMTSTGDPSTALVLRSGADTEMTSSFASEEVKLIADAPGLARSDLGALASPELFVVINLPKRSSGTDANVPLRGVTPTAFGVHRKVRLVEGRRFEAGRNEVMVGNGAAAAFAGLDVGSKIKLGRYEWDVVGRFEAQGSLAESEIWTDANVLQASYERTGFYQVVAARLGAPSNFKDFKDALTTNPRLNVKVLRQDEFYAEQSRLLYGLITGLGILVAGLMAIGAVFGALNTMYAAVATRTREIATLRALGFGSSAVVVSVLVESIGLALLGGSLGGGLAYIAFDGFRAATLNWQSFSQVAFAFDVTPQLLILGIVCATAIGFVGGLLPAVRAARLPVARALREV
jgi:putative ABC transport system permease protein